MTKKQLKLIKDLLLFSKPCDAFVDAYNYVVCELIKEIKKHEVKK